MTTWSFIGSGNIGSTVAELAIAAGHDVVLSNSRGPDTLADLVHRLGPAARAATPADAAAAGDVVVVTIPLKNYRQVPADPLRGTIVVDTMNYYPDRDGRIAELADGSTTSAELFQAAVPESRVVKAFNNIFFRHLAVLARPAGSADRSALPIAGDDSEANATVAALLDQIGYDAVDLGPLSASWRSQPGTPVYGTPYAAQPDDWSAGARPADAATIADLAARARR
jgi:8-hydroxy-5-deazaflavin:NADPH oxidoreductase